MPNTLVTSSIVAEESLAVLENMVTFGAACNRDWEDTFQSASAAGYKTGATINIKRPPRYTYRPVASRRRKTPWKARSR